MIELTNQEIISKVKDHVEELVDDRNLDGICIFIQSKDRKESGFYMIGRVNKLDIFNILTTFYKEDALNV